MFSPMICWLSVNRHNVDQKVNMFSPDICWLSVNKHNADQSSTCFLLRFAGYLSTDTMLAKKLTCFLLRFVSYLSTDTMLAITLACFLLRFAGYLSTDTMLAKKFNMFSHKFYGTDDVVYNGWWDFAMAIFVAALKGVSSGHNQYSDITMSATAFQITGVSIVCPTDCSGASKLRATGLCEWNPPVTSGFPLKTSKTRKMLSYDDVIMIQRKFPLAKKTYFQRVLCRVLSWPEEVLTAHTSPRRRTRWQPSWIRYRHSPEMVAWNIMYSTDDI